MAAHAELGGVSRVREAADRAAQLKQDQGVGQLGEIALSKYLGGTPLFYELTRVVRGMNPDRGDGGADLLATNVDVKCSQMRAGLDPLRYRLLVRPQERVATAVYVLALVGADVWQTGLVQLVGWCTDAQLPRAPVQSGVFAGAFVVPATSLTPLPPIRFNWIWNYNEVTLRCTG
jgi:hypothetical protein